MIHPFLLSEAAAMDIPNRPRVLRITGTQAVWLRLAMLRASASRNAKPLFVSLVIGSVGICWGAARYRVATADAYFDGGLHLYREKRYDAAIWQYRQAIRILPNYSGSYDNWGLCLEAQGHVDQALAKYRYALSLDPNNTHAHSNLGSALFLRGNVPAGLAELREAVRARPGDARSHMMLGSALYRAGDHEQARQEWRKVADKGDQEATHDLQKFGGN